MSAETTANGQTPVLELKGLSKSFGGLHAVRGVTFRIMPGDRKAIIGNGYLNGETIRLDGAIRMAPK